MTLPEKIDVALDWTGMGEFGVLRLVFCIATIQGSVTMSTSSVRIDRESHGKVYRNHNFCSTVDLLWESESSDGEEYEAHVSPASMAPHHNLDAEQLTKASAALGLNIEISHPEASRNTISTPYSQASPNLEEGDGPIRSGINMV